MPADKAAVLIAHYPSRLKWEPKEEKATPSQLARSWGRRPATASNGVHGGESRRSGEVVRVPLRPEGTEKGFREGNVKGTEAWQEIGSW